MTITLASKATSVKRSLPSIPEISTASGVAAEAQTTLVIIDSGVEDYSVLAAGVLSNIKTVILDPNQDGVAQITEALQAHPHTTSLHIVSHGSPGCLYLGNTQLNLETLDRHSWDLQSWFSLLPNDSTTPFLLLYGCNTAAGAAGAEFLTHLHQLTGAEIAASANLVGSTSLGGSWDLKVTTGIRQRAIAFDAETLESFPHTLTVVIPGFTESVYATGLLNGAGLTIDPLTRTLYVAAENTIGILQKVASDRTVSTVTSDFTPGGEFYPFIATDIQFFGGFVYSALSDGANGRLVRINTSTGATTTLTTLSGFGVESGLAIKGSKLLITDGTGSANQIREYDLNTGVVTTRVSALPANSYSLEYDLTADKFYFASPGSGFFSANPDTSTFTAISGATSGSSNFAVEPSGQYIYVRVGSTVNRISTSNGSSTPFLTGLLGNQNNDLAFGPSSSGGGSNLYSLYVVNGTSILEVSGFFAPNNAPSLTGDGVLPVVPEDSTNPTGQTISSLVGSFFSDPNVGSSFGGVAVVGNTAPLTEGVWEYSTDAGAIWNAIATVTDGATALALSAATLVRFLPAADYNGTPTNLTVRALDDTYAGGFTDGATRITVDTTTNGGATAIAASTNTIGTSITSVNDNPVVSASQLFAITQDDKVAENLPYGPQSLTPADSAFLDTQQGSVIHNSFTQIGTDGAQTLYTITWQFSTSKTLEQRFADAVSTGEPVTWTVISTSQGTQTYTGTWRFSDSAGNLAAKFAGSGFGFSSDDGVWGATNGILNANGTFGVAIAWGHGNFDSSDVADSLYLNGVDTPIPANFKNLMYIGSVNSTNKTATEDSAAFPVDLLAGASDPDGDPLSVSNLSLTSGNTAGVTVNGNSLTVDPNAYNSLAVGESEVITYGYDITDGNGGSAAQTATITITGVNDAPSVGASVSQSATEDAAGFSVNLLSGASDVDGDTLNVSDLSLTSGSAAGVTVNGNNLTVDPNAYTALAVGESEVITYGYNVNDGNGGITPQTATITITGVNDAPSVGASVTQTATEDAAGFSVDLLTGASDVDGDTLNVSNLSLTSGSAVGVTVNGNSLTVDPNAYNSLAVGESEVITYGYNVNDGNGGITPQTATITITGVNDAPNVGASVSQSATEDAAGFSVNLLAGATDVDGDTLNVSNLSLTSGSAAGVTVNGNNLTVDPNAYNSLAVGESEVITYGYNVNDGNGGITPQTATITITGVNDAPSLTSDAVLPVVPEDSTNPTGQTISSLVGSLFSDPDAAASLSGVAVVGNTANAITEGKWQYSTDGATWADVGTVTDSVTALALSATTELRFLPVAGYNGTPAALTIRALDNTYSGVFGTTINTTTRGGSTAIAAATNTISTTVLPSADVTSVSATTLDGAYNAGDAIAITVTFDEIVNVTGIGIPQLTLETGTTDAIANYTSGSGTNTLTFLYTVGAGETSVDLDYLSTTALSLNGGSIRNASGIDANLTLPTPGAANSLGANKSLVIDTTAPAIPAIASFTTDSGVAGDNITNDTTLTFSGTAEVNSTVTLTLDGTAAGTVVADQSGNWTYTPAVLSEGTHTLSAIATDAAGNSSAASPVLSLLIDTTAPATPAIPDLTAVSDTGRSNTDNITNDTTPTLNGTAEANSTVSVFSGTTLLGRAIADPVGSWTFTAAALASGSYSITTQVMDAAGNTSAPSPSLALTIDTAAPTAPLNLDLTTASDRGVSSTDNKTSETKPTFTGAAEANSIVELFAGTQSLGVTTSDATGNWSFSVPTALAAGSYNITTQATDVAGNASPSSTPLMLTIQTIVPTVSTLNITPDVRDSNVGVVSLQFSEAVTNFDLTALTLTHEGVVISLVGAILTSQDNRTWVLELPSALTTIEGRYQLSVSTSTITSTAGNPLAAGTSDTWLVGYTATAFAPIDFQGERLTGIRIRGTNESERFEGTFRSDLLMGMGGHDVLIAGFGKAQFGVDRLYGGNGNDILISGNGKDLLYGERGRDRLLGGNGSDYLDGGSDGDRLLGGKGNDVLVGGTGNDMLSGKAGKDTFVCNTLNEGMDIVTDFNGAEDLLDLRNIMRQSGFGGDNAFARFTQYVQLHQVGANTEVRIDTDGNRSGQDFTTVLTLKNTTLSTVNSRQFVIV